jgi:hypothetical protein
VVHAHVLDRQARLERASDTQADRDLDPLTRARGDDATRVVAGRGVAGKRQDERHLGRSARRDRHVVAVEPHRCFRGGQREPQRG